MNALRRVDAIRRVNTTRLQRITDAVQYADQLLAQDVIKKEHHDELIRRLMGWES